MNTDFEDKISRYLAKVAEQNPDYLPTAMAQVMMMKMELMLMGCWQKAIEMCFDQLQSEFDKLIESVRKGEAGGR
jgi:hypothetical protein